MAIEADRRILIISSVSCPPPHLGNCVRVATLLDELRRLGLEVHFAGVRMSEADKASTLPHVDKWVADFKLRKDTGPALRQPMGLFLRKFRRLLRRLQILEDPLDRDFCPEWLAEAHELQRRCSYTRVLVVYVFHSKFLQAFPDPCVRVLETQDIFTHRRQRLASVGIAEYIISYTRRDERRGLRRANRIIAIQEEEAKFFRKLLGRSTPVWTVGYFAMAQTLPPPPAGAIRLGFIGSNNPQNRQGLGWFLQEVWPILRQQLPQVEIWLAGAICASAPSGPGIILLGKVPALESFYTACPLLVNPIRAGTGLKIKTIESLACGRPIVTTSVGAEGLDEFKGNGLVATDSPADFADAIIHLLKNAGSARQLGAAALGLAQAYFARNRRAFTEVLSINSLSSTANKAVEVAAEWRGRAHDRAD